VIADLAGQGNNDLLSAVTATTDRITAYGSLIHPTDRTALTATWRVLGEAIVPTPTPAPTPAPTPTPTPLVTPSIRSTIPTLAGTRARARKSFTLKGTATATSGSVLRVQVAIRQVKKGTCLWLRTSKGRQFKASKPVRGACTKPIFLSATGTTSWSLRLAQGLPAGTYEVTSRATLSTGLVETSQVKGSNVRRLTVK
jgi:hypothetical protein